MKYRVLCNDVLEDLEKDVNELIQEGYQPLGGIQVEPPFTDGRWGYMQAMIKKDEVTK